MPVFAYKAMDAAGARVAGIITSASEQAVISDLESRKLVPVAVMRKRETSLVPARKVSARRLAQTYVQLADLLRAGVPLLRALKLLANRRSQPRLAAVFKEVSDAVAEGDELGEAMSRRPEVFPRVHVAMIRAGEKGGFLESVLSRLGQFVMSEAELRGKIISSMVYPGLLVTVGSIILGVVFGFFVPMFRTMLDRTDAGVPTLTRFVFGVGDAVGKYGLVTLAVVVVALIAMWRVSRVNAVRRSLAVARTRVPVFGPLVRAIAAARFCRMLGTMLANGIPMLTAMQVAKEAAGNVLMEEAIDNATESVRAGAALAPPLADSGLFSDEVIEMISVAETANNLDEMLITIADTLESRVNRLLGTAVGLIGPLMVLLIAVVVGVVAAALLLPMVSFKAAF